MEHGLLWILVLGAVLLTAGTYSLVARALTSGMNLYEWVTGGGTLSLGVFFVLTFFERIEADRPDWRRLLAAGRWSSFVVFLLFVGIGTFLGLSDALG